MGSHDEHAPIWHVQHLTLTETTAAVARGFGGGLGLEYVASLRHITARIRFEDLDRRPLVVPGGDIHHRNETLLGPGDPWLMAVAGRRIGPWSAALRGGITIPLGKTEANPFDLGRRGLPHQHIQFGTGTWDPLAGASLGRRFGEVMTSATVLARLPVSENRHGYRAGRRVQVVTYADRRIRGPWRAQAGLDYGRETAETWSGLIEEEGNLGRSDLLLSAGIARLFGSRALILTAKVPLRTRSNGVQIDYPAIVSLGWGN
jgi:hypothetical protein